MLNGRPFRDLDGEELADEAAARRMTLTIMGEVLRGGEIDVRGAGPFRILCTDTAGAVVTGLIAEAMSAKAVAHMLARLNVGAVQDQPWKDVQLPGRSSMAVEGTPRERRTQTRRG